MRGRLERLQSSFESFSSRSAFYAYQAATAGQTDDLLAFQWRISVEYEALLAVGGG